MVSKEIEFIIVSFYFHNERFKADSILGYVSCCVIYNQLVLRRRDDHSRLVRVHSGGRRRFLH